MLTRDFVTECKRRAALKSAPLKATARRDQREQEERDAKRARHAARGALYLRAHA